MFKQFLRNVVHLLSKILLITKKKPYVVDVESTIDFVIKNHVSVSRFGDGELRWMIGEETGYGFQQSDKLLALRLRSVLESNIPNHIVCIPNVFGNTKYLIPGNRVAWDIHKLKYGKKWLSLMDSEKTYYDSNMTRFYIDYNDKTLSEHLFNKIKLLWDNRPVLIVEGEFTRFGYQNDLLANSTKVLRIQCPAENAFSLYETIEKKVCETRQTLPEDTLILVALGPTATVLAADLAKKGFQTVDIGHLDLEYEWFLKGAKERINLDDRYVNEVDNGTIISTFDNENYNCLKKETILTIK